MRRTFEIPAFLHDVLGESQRPGDLVAVVGFGLGATLAAIALAPETFAAVPLWQAALAILLIADIAAGCVANLTSGTNDFYAARARNRLIFIAIHVHILAVALLLNLDLTAAAAIWAHTILGSLIINALPRGATQRVWAGTLFGMGAFGIALLGSMEPILAAIGLLFMVKVMVNFAVDHRAEARST